MIKKIFRGMDILGNIAVVKFSDEAKTFSKRRIGKKLLKENKSLKTILEKTGKFKGRLRKMETRFVVGEKTKEVLYKENGCIFRFNIDKTYFSPRLNNERKEVAGKIKKNDSVLVMFAGVAPYPIVIAKKSKAKLVVSNEINRGANKYAKLNVELNKLKDKIELIPGDIKRIARKGGLNVKGTLAPLKFDVIVMPRPKLKETFLKQAFMLSKKGTRIYYYGFSKIDEINLIIDGIKEEAKKNRKKIRILNKKIAGEIAPYKARVRIDFKVL